MSAVLGLGLAALGRPGYLTLGHAQDVTDPSHAGMQAAAFAVLDEAWALGLRHFDAARSYGDAEAFLSAWLAASGHEGAVVSSKWGYRYTANWQRTAEVHEVKDHSFAHFELQWAESRALLGRQLNTYQVHSLTPDSPVFDDRLLLDRLAQLREAGVTIGASVSGPGQGETIDRLLAIERAGRRLFGSVQATWNVLEPSAGPALLRAKAAGLTVIVKEGVANGLLTSRGTHQPLLDAALARATTPDALALAIVLAQPFADVVLSGAATVEQLRSNAAALALGVAPSLLEDSALPAGHYWRQRAGLSWS